MPEQGDNVDQVFDSMQVWLELDDRGLACLIYRYEDTRNHLMSRLRPVLQDAKLKYAELQLPVNKSVAEVIAWLKHSLDANSQTILFLSGWETALPPGPSRADAIRQINFQREALALHPVQQIWCFTEQFEHDFFSSAPDFYSWFEIKWRILDMPKLQFSVSPTHPASLTELTTGKINSTTRQQDARKRVAVLRLRILEAKKRRLPLAKQLGTFISAMTILEDAFLLHEAVLLLGDVFPSLNTLLKQKDVSTAMTLFYLGLVARSRLNYPEAIYRSNEARLRFQYLADIQGEANCILTLGEIALARSDHETARARYEEARPMYRQTGNILGEANCIQGFGNIALKKLEVDVSRQLFEQAIKMYVLVGDVEGEGDCLRGLGDSAIQLGDIPKAKLNYEKSLELFTQIQNPHFIGEIHQRLARIADSEEEKQFHLTAARKAWQSIGFDHLIAELDAEFGK